MFFEMLAKKQAGGDTNNCPLITHLHFYQNQRNRVPARKERQKQTKTQQCVQLWKKQFAVSNDVLNPGHLELITRSIS